MQAAYWKPGDSEPLARFDDEVVRHALELARLTSLACEIDGEDNWPQRLSAVRSRRSAADGRQRGVWVKMPHTCHSQLPVEIDSVG